MASRAARVLLVVLACVVPAGCSDDSAGPTEDPAEPSSGSGQTPTSGAGAVEFDLRSGDSGVDRTHPAVRAYATWQRAATQSIRGGELSDAVRDHALEPPVRTVERSVDRVNDAGLTVPRRMVGRLHTVRTTPRAAILGVCLWSPTFDYRARDSGRRVTQDRPRWMGVEVRMTRGRAHDDVWKVSGLTAQQSCQANEGS